jgi:hypothetical protein
MRGKGLFIFGSGIYRWREISSADDLVPLRQPDFDDIFPPEFANPGGPFGVYPFNNKERGRLCSLPYFSERMIRSEVAQISSPAPHASLCTFVIS